MIEIHERKLTLDEAVMRKLRDKALARAGSSSTLNDLAAILSGPSPRKSR
jgi:hypothetical protein